MQLKSIRKTNYIFSYVFIICGIALLICTLSFLFVHNNRINTWEHIDGIISSVDTNKERIEVKYLLNDKYVFNKINYYSSKLDVGDEIDLYLNQEKLYAGEFEFVSLITIFLSLIFGSIGIISFIVLKKADKNREICLRDGSKKKVTVTKFIRTNYNNGINRSYRMIIFHNNKKYKSEYFNVPKKYKEFENGIVDIYLLENGKYYIDINSYRENKVDELK